MANIMVEIKCNKKSCGQCPMGTGLLTDRRCAIFKKGLSRDKPTRLPECIAAEIPPEIGIAAFKLLQEYLQKSEYPPLTMDEIDELLEVTKDLHAELKNDKTNPA